MEAGQLFGESKQVQHDGNDGYGFGADMDDLSLLDDDTVEPNHVWNEVVGTDIGPTKKLATMQDHVALLRQKEEALMAQLEHERAKLGLSDKR
jgi:hypothetical protein